MMNVMLETDVPIMSAVLTPSSSTSTTFTAFFYDHLVKKGREATDAAVATVANLRSI